MPWLPDNVLMDEWLTSNILSFITLETASESKHNLEHHTLT